MFEPEAVKTRRGREETEAKAAPATVDASETPAKRTKAKKKKSEET